MKVFTVKAKWVETFTLYIRAEDADSAEEIVSAMISDGVSVQGDAVIVDKDWTIDTPYQTDEEINPKDIVDIYE
jgi:hypothetical protein